MNLGDFPEDFATVTCMFTTHAASGAPVAPSTAFEAADIIIYKNGSGTQKTTTNGVTMTSPFDSITGLHCVVIDTSNDTGDGGFWVAGAQYTLVLSPDETVDSVAVVKVVGTFGIELSEVLRPTTAGRQLDVSAGGEAGLDWANIGSPTTAQNLSATNIDVDQVVASVSGAVGSVTGNVGGNVTGSVGSIATGGIVAASFTAGAIDAAAIASNAIGASELDAGASTEIANAVWATATRSLTIIDEDSTTLDLDATIQAALATPIATIANLDTALELDGAVYRYTTNALEQAPTGGSAPTVGQIADEVQTRTIAAVTLVNGLAANTVTASALAADAVTEIQSGLATSAALATAQTSIDDLPTNAELATALGTADDAVLAQVALVKAKTDSLTFTVANVLDANIQRVNDVLVSGTGAVGDEWGP